MYRVMIVDDEASASNTIRRYMETRLPEFEICAVLNNGPEAIRTFLHAPADIVFIDIRMPLMDGLTLIGELNKITRDLSLIHILFLLFSLISRNTLQKV